MYAHYNTGIYVCKLFTGYFTGLPRSLRSLAMTKSLVRLSLRTSQGRSVAIQKKTTGNILFFTYGLEMGFGVHYM